MSELFNELLRNLMEHGKHITRALLILFLVVVGYGVLRGILVPHSFGEKGFYRAQNIEEQMNKEVVHGGNNSCKPCHEKQYAKITTNEHKTLSCESCHEPVLTHANEKEKIADMITHKENKLCLRCHGYMDARDKDFPQIVLKTHLEENEAKLKDAVCFDCHNKHSPAEDPEEEPEEKIVEEQEKTLLPTENVNNGQKSNEEENDDNKKHE